MKKLVVASGNKGKIKEIETKEHIVKGIKGGISYEGT